MKERLYSTGRAIARNKMLTVGLIAFGIGVYNMSNNLYNGLSYESEATLRPAERVTFLSKNYRTPQTEESPRRALIDLGVLVAGGSLLCLALKRKENERKARIR